MPEFLLKTHMCHPRHIMATAGDPKDDINFSLIRDVKTLYKLEWNLQPSVKDPIHGDNL